MVQDGAVVPRPSDLPAVTSDPDHRGAVAIRVRVPLRRVRQAPVKCGCAVGLLILIMSGSCPAQEPPASAHMSPNLPHETQASADSVERQGVLLKADIQSSFARMRREGTLSARLTGNDITEVIARHIKSGEDFKVAEQTLARAGFRVEKRPGVSAPGTRVDRFDVYGFSPTMLPTPDLFSNVEVRVCLSPDSPAAYNTVKAARGWIFFHTL